MHRIVYVVRTPHEELEEVSQVTGRLLVAPQNRVALLGESVKLDCSTDLKFSVDWQHTPLGSTKPTDVYISRIVVEPYHPRFAIHIQRIIEKRSLGNNITVYNLLIADIRMEDAGTYSCTDRTGMGERRDAQLTVLGSLPKCTTNIGPNGFVGENDCRHPIDEIHSSCSIEYAGNSVPNMRWMITSGQDTVQAQPITSVSGKTVSSEWGFMATTSMNEASVIWFSTQSALTKWTSAPIKTLYVKQNLTTLILSQSETVTCTVNSSQHCSYTWTAEMDKSKPIEGPTLEVNKPGTYLCHAQCPLHQLSCSVKGMRVEYRNGDECKHKNGYWGVAFGLLTTGFLAIVAIMAFYIWKLRAKRHCPSGTPSSNSASSLTVGNETCLSKTPNSNDNCKSSTSPAYEKEGLVNV